MGAKEDAARRKALKASRALPPGQRIALAYDILNRGKRLREEVREDLRLQRFGADDVQMEMYNDLANIAAGLFPDDLVLGKQLILMPDAVLQSYGTLLPIQSMANYLPSRRLEARLSRLIERLEMILGEPPTEYRNMRPAADVLAQAQTPETREIKAALEEMLRKQPKLPVVDVRDFGFVQEVQLQRVLSEDYIEAQRAFASEAFKAASILSGGLIEGMLLDLLRRPEIMDREQYHHATRAFPRLGDDINWHRVSLSQLIDAARDLGLLGDNVLRLSEGARDFRDTVHPTAEVRERVRAGREEAELLLALVKLVYRDLSSRDVPK